MTHIKHKTCSLNQAFKLLLFLVISGFNGTISCAQQVSAAFAEFNPETFSGYPSSGVFTATFGKTSGRIPAGTAQVLFTMVSEIQWDGNAITSPVGWTMAPESTPTNIRFTLSRDWNDGSDQDLKWMIPVTASASRADATVAVTSQIQQKDGNWSIAAPLTSTSIMVTATPLPVLLFSFDVKAEGTTAHLDWSTTAETNSALFDIERSGDGKVWTKIGTVEAGGERTVTSKYSFIDDRPEKGENLYRLKMQDHDGSFAYSRMRSISFAKDSGLFFVFPNPSSNIIQIDSETFKTAKSVAVFDAVGKLVYSSQSAGLSAVIDMSLYPTGTYIMQLSDQTGVLRALKFVMVR